MSFKLVASQFFLEKKKATSLSKEANAFCWPLVLIESLGMWLEALGGTILPKLPLSANPHPGDLFNCYRYHFLKILLIFLQSIDYNGLIASP